MKFKNLFIASLLYCVFCAVPSFAQTGLQDLKRAIKEWDDLFNSGQVEQLLTLYSDDIVSMPYNTPTIHGKDTLRANFKEFLDANIVQHETHVEEILNTSDWAIERASYTLKFRPRAGGKEKVETGRHVVCRKRKDGRWLITWEIWNTDTPVENTLK